MKKMVKRITATAAIAAAMLIGAQGVATAEADPINDTEVPGLGLLDGLLVNAPVLNNINISLDILGLPGR